MKSTAKPCQISSPTSYLVKKEKISCCQNNGRSQSRLTSVRGGGKSTEKCFSTLIYSIVKRFRQGEVGQTGVEAGGNLVSLCGPRQIAWSPGWQPTHSRLNNRTQALEAKSNMTEVSWPRWCRVAWRNFGCPRDDIDDCTGGFQSWEEGSSLSTSLSSSLAKVFQDFLKVCVKIDSNKAADTNG